MENKIDTTCPTFSKEDVSLRDHFAGMAMQGVCASCPEDVDVDIMCKFSYQVADAMLKARDQ